MELGIHFIDFLPGDDAALTPNLLSTATAAEDIGATLFTLADHFFQMENVGRAEDPFLEGYTSLGYLAGRTTTISLALLVTGVTYRHPGLLAKTVTTLDVLSQGRSMFGIGAAWYEREHLALGVPYPSVSTRFEMLEETLQICQQMWSKNDGSYEGKHFQLAETICQPQPIRRPPILIGGGGEKKTLRLVAQYADVWNSTDSDIDVLTHKVDVLTRHCDTVGRDVAKIRKTVGFFEDPFSDLDGYLKRIDQMAGLGVDMINTGPVPGSPDPAGFVKRYGDEVMPRLSEIG
jgi:F420-dependent oxidoreductase-like protein